MLRLAGGVGKRARGSHGDDDGETALYAIPMNSSFVLAESDGDAQSVGAVIDKAIDDLPTWLNEFSIADLEEIQKVAAPNNGKYFRADTSIRKYSSYSKEMKDLQASHEIGVSTLSSKLTLTDFRRV